MSADSAVVLGTVIPQVVPAGMVHDVSNDLHRVQQALARLAANRHPGEYRVVAQPTVVCSGQTLLEALEDATAFVKQSPDAQVHSLSLAVVLGPEEGEREYRLTLAVSYPDGHGETTGTTHHEARTPRG
jgi:hypothetical protein